VIEQQHKSAVYQDGIDLSVIPSADKGIHFDPLQCSYCELSLKGIGDGRFEQCSQISHVTSEVFFKEGVGFDERIGFDRLLEVKFEIVSTRNGIGKNLAVFPPKLCDKVRRLVHS
jgi:hypothetical protein